MIAKNKTRIMVTLTNDLISELDRISAQMGVTKSQLIAVTLGEKVMAYKKSFEVVDQLGLEARRQMTSKQEPLPYPDAKEMTEQYFLILPQDEKGYAWACEVLDKECATITLQLALNGTDDVHREIVENNMDVIKELGLKKTK